jgi:hypothetical protein
MKQSNNGINNTISVIIKKYTLVYCDNIIKIIQWGDLDSILYNFILTYFFKLSMTF